MNNEITIEYLKQGESKTFDLDGHGFTESICFFMTEADDNGCPLNIVEIMVEGSSSDEIFGYDDEPTDATFKGKYERKLAIVTVPELSQKLIILSGVTFDDDPISEVFMYKSGKVRYLGSCEGTLETETLRIESDGTFFSNTKSEYFSCLTYVLEYVVHRNELVPLMRWMYVFSDDSIYTTTTLMDYEFYDEPYDSSERTMIPEGSEVTFLTTSETGWVEVDFEGTSYYFFTNTNGEIEDDEDFTTDMLFEEVY